MFKKVLHLTFIVFVLSLFLYQNVSYAYPSTGTVKEQNAWETVTSDREIAYQALKGKETAYSGARAAVGDLNAQWDRGKNEENIKKGAKVTVDAFANFAIGLVATALTKGAGAVAYAPSVFNGYVAGKAGLSGSYSFSPDKYTGAMSTALSLFDTARSDSKAAYATYTTAYAAYLKVISEHSGGLVRYNGNGVSAVYSQTQLDMTVNSTPPTTKGWYHPGGGSTTNHTIFPRWPETHWDFKDIPEEYPCDGACSVKHRTPYEAYTAHRKKCGPEDSYYVWKLQQPISVQIELNSRSAAEGCGLVWYSCDSDDDKQTKQHKVRECTKDFTAKNGVTRQCGDSFRKCMFHKKDHNLSSWWEGKSYHSDDDSNSDEEANAVGFSPASGSSYTASAGDTHTGTVTAPSIYGAYLYVNGSRIGWFRGSSTATSLALSYTFLSDASGDYEIKARVYPWSGDTYGTYTDYSYTVTIGVGDSTSPGPTPMHACRVHELWQSGDHSRITPACGVLDHAGNACQIASSHTSAVSCPTDINGVSCSYGTYYTCSPHTHSYPAATTVTAPIWRDIPDPYFLTVGDSFRLYLNSYVTGSPTITRNGGVIPSGLSFRNGIVSGRVRRVESRGFRFTATNAAGSAVSEWVNITVEAAQ